MPGLNKQGPMGQGPMTGWKMGRCTNFGESLKKKDETENEKTDQELPEDFPGRGMGYGRGRGFGFCGGRGRGGRGRGLGRGRGFGE